MRSTFPKPLAEISNPLVKVSIPPYTNSPFLSRLGTSVRVSLPSTTLNFSPTAIDSLKPVFTLLLAMALTSPQAEQRIFADDIVSADDDFMPLEFLPGGLGLFKIKLYSLKLILDDEDQSDNVKTISLDTFSFKTEKKMRARGEWISHFDQHTKIAVKGLRGEAKGVEFLRVGATTVVVEDEQAKRKGAAKLQGDGRTTVDVSEA